MTRSAAPEGEPVPFLALGVTQLATTKTNNAFLCARGVWIAEEVVVERVLLNVNEELVPV